MQPLIKFDHFYKCKFGYPVKNLIMEPDNDQPLIPIKGEVLVNGESIEGRWSLTGQVLALQFDIRWSLVEINRSEWLDFIYESNKKGMQMELF